MSQPRRDRGRDRERDVDEKLRPPMSRDEVDIMLITMMRSRAVRSEACRFLKPEYFHADERACAILARVVAALADDHADVEDVPYLDLCAAVDAEIAALGEGAADDEWNDLLAVPGKAGDWPGLLHHAYMDLKPGDFKVSAALRRLRRFVEERGVDRPIRDAVLASGGRVVANWAQLFEERQALRESLGTITEAVAGSVDTFRFDGTTAAVAVVPTGLSFVDHATDGGLAAAEVYGITSPTGGGKSTAAHQIAMEFAQAYQGMAEVDGVPLRDSLVFSYEDTAKDMVLRSLAYAAQIPRTRMEHLRDPEVDLLRVPCPHDAELARAKGVPVEGFPTEYERYRRAKEWMRKNYFWFDMTQPGLGDGGVDEICSIIARHVEQTGRQPGLVVVDSIDLMAESWFNQAHGDVDAQRLLASGIPRLVHRLKRRIAVAYQCPLLITNQLAGANLKKSSGARLSHADAALSKSWAKPLTFHWILGGRNEDGVALFDCTKGRRGGHAGTYALVRLDGEYARWVDVSDLYTFQNGDIVTRTVAETVQGPVRPRTMPRTLADNFGDVADAAATDAKVKGV